MGRERSKRKRLGGSSTEEGTATGVAQQKADNKLGQTQLLRPA